MASDVINIRSPESIALSADDIFKRLVQRANKGTTVKSTSAPAFSSQFVKSSASIVASPGKEGAFSEIVYPAYSEIKSKLERKHGQDYANLLGYASTQDADAYPAGFGERSARALAREESTYQLKGSFPAASLNFAKLRARVAARDGDVEATEQLFAKMWGLNVDQVRLIPHLHVDGSEATRLSAMEDRAYHSLSGHPGHVGGFRVNTATIASDALGINVPLNWPRLRVALKMIANTQLNADIQLGANTRLVSDHHAVRFRMDMTVGSQPVYERPAAWESLILGLLEVNMSQRGTLPMLGTSIPDSLGDRYLTEIKQKVNENLLRKMRKTANLVAMTSAKAYEKTRQIMLEHDRERAIITQGLEEEYDTLKASHLSTTFEVPRYLVTRDTFNKGIHRQKSKDDSLPDMMTQRPNTIQLSLDEFRAAKMTMPLSVAGALNLASYITATSLLNQPFIHMLVRLVPDPRDDFHHKASIRLRRQPLYDGKEIRKLGVYLLSDVFVSTLSMLLSNLVTTTDLSEVSIKTEMWRYLSARTLKKRECPVTGSWKDLILELRTLPEGWSIYYWMRVSAGRKHHASCGGIFAPIAAGESVDLRTLFRRGFEERKRNWAAYYTAEYKLIEEGLARMVETGEVSTEETLQAAVDEGIWYEKYIPPHVRRMITIEQGMDKHKIPDREDNNKKHDFERMVEMQSKAKIFSHLRMFTVGDRVCVGLPDDVMCEMLTEFYKARWLSLETRIEAAKKENRVFKLGRIALKEHPWGALCEELPTDLEGMLQFTYSLKEVGWTVPPRELQDKFRKSLTELWGDLFEELDAIMKYIEEVHSGELEVQEELDVGLSSPYQSLLRADPIALPVMGYVPPYTLPTKTSQIIRQEGEQLLTSTIEIVAGSLVSASTPQEVVHIPDDELLSDEDELSLGAVMMTEAPTLPSDIVEVEARYHSYRDIWQLLEMPKVEDDKMRLGFGLDVRTDLNAEHLEPGIGPLILEGEEKTVWRKWGSKKSLMLRRCGYTTASVTIDDM